MMRPSSLEEYLQSYPRTCAVIIAYSLGYASPRCAASILKDAHERQENYSEWITACYGYDARRAVTDAIRARHALRGYMADYDRAGPRPTCHPGRGGACLWEPVLRRALPRS